MKPKACRYSPTTRSPWCHKPEARWASIRQPRATPWVMGRHRERKPCKGAITDRRLSGYDALSGLTAFLGSLQPRALPWAVVSEPFRLDRMATRAERRCKVAPRLTLSPIPSASSRSQGRSMSESCFCEAVAHRGWRCGVRSSLCLLFGVFVLSCFRDGAQSVFQGLRPSATAAARGADARASGWAAHRRRTARPHGVARRKRPQAVVVHPVQMCG